MANATPAAAAAPVEVVEAPEFTLSGSYVKSYGRQIVVRDLSDPDETEIVKVAKTGTAVIAGLTTSRVMAVLFAAAEKLDIDAPRSGLPVASDTLALADTIGENPAIQRAMAFGAEQILAQHRGLWNLLEAREAARDMW